MSERREDLSTADIAGQQPAGTEPPEQAPRGVGPLERVRRAFSPDHHDDRTADDRTADRGADGPADRDLAGWDATGHDPADGDAANRDFDDRDPADRTFADGDAADRSFADGDSENRSFGDRNTADRELSDRIPGQGDRDAADRDATLPPVAPLPGGAAPAAPPSDAPRGPVSGVAGAPMAATVDEAPVAATDGAATPPPAGEHRTPTGAPPLPGTDTEGFRARWTDVQNGFVDSPRDAVQKADALTAELMQHLAKTFADERGRLESQWSRGDDVPTDDLRTAFQRYRSFFERLLST